MRLEQEVSLIKRNAIGGGIAEASKTATDVITEIGSTGIKVHPSGQSGAEIVDYTQIDADGMEVYQGGDMVAAFGASGAQVGSADSSHIELSADHMSIVNDDGATMFDVDMDAGSMYAYGGRNPAHQGAEEVIKATATGSYTKQVVYQVALEGLSSGDKVIIPSGNTLAANYSRVNSYVFADITIQSVSSGMTYNQIGYSQAYNITADIQFVYGTAIQDETYTVAGTVSKASASVNGSFTNTITFSYSGGSSFTITVSTSLTVSSMGAEWLDFNIFAWMPGYKYYIQTKGAALAFGTRQAGSDIGLLSATFGEGLIAASEKQAVFGAYNEADTHDVYAIILGNGISNDVRVNTFAVKWDGTVEAANPSQTRLNMGIDAGVTASFSCSANAVTTKEITFNKTFASAPNVVVGFYSTSTAAAFGGLAVAVKDITTTGCTAVVFNNTSTGRSPQIEWIAVG